MKANSPICILGSNSFAGATFAKFLLDQGFRVLGISRSQTSFPTALLLRESQKRSSFRFEQIDINHDLSKLELVLDEETPEFIFDFAGQGMVAESWTHPEQWLQTNLISKTRLLEILRTKSWLIKYIRASTPEVYGSHESKILEAANYAPTTPYAITHASIDMTLAAYNARYGFPSVIGRFSNFYGPGQQLYRIVPKTILSASRGMKLPLHGGGLSERSFIFSSDLNAALLSLAERGVSGQIYNFSSEELISIRSLVELITKNLGCEFDECVELVGERPSKDHKYLMDSSKAKRDLSWEAKISLEIGLQQTMRWFSGKASELADIPLDYSHKP
jgi:dTDP-glucose 4,6-dehydratase